MEKESTNQSAPSTVRIALAVVCSALFYYLVFWGLLAAELSSLLLVVAIFIAALYLAEKVLKLVLGVKAIVPTPSIRDDSPGAAFSRMPANFIPFIIALPALLVPFNESGNISIPAFVALAVVAVCLETFLLGRLLSRKD